MGELRTAEGPVLDRPDQVAMVCGGLALDLTPLLVAHERSPRGIPRRLVRPLEQIDEFEAPVARALPHVEDAEAVVAHETGGMIPEARVECLEFEIGRAHV